MQFDMGQLLALLRSLGIGGGSMPQPGQMPGATPPQMPGSGMGGPGMGDRGPPPGMGWRRPGFPGQGHAYGRMGMRPPQMPQAPQMPQPAPAPAMPTPALSATATPTPPAPMQRPQNFGQTMSAWAHSKPDRPDNFDGAWGQSPAMDTWRNARPTKPTGAL